MTEENVVIYRGINNLNVYVDSLSCKSYWTIAIHAKGLGGGTIPSMQVMVYGDNLGDLSFFQMETDITQVDAPSSTIHWEMMALWTWTGIWKEMDGGNGDVLTYQ